MSNKPKIYIARGWIAFVAGVVAVIIALLTYSRECKQQSDSPTLKVEAELDRYERLLVQVKSSIPDSVAAGRERASRRGFAGGSVHHYEVSGGLRPLQDSLSSRLFELGLSVRTALLIVGITDTTVGPHGRLLTLRMRTDSVLASIDSILEAQ